MSLEPTPDLSSPPAADPHPVPGFRWARTRHAFYELFAASMSHPVERLDSPPRVCWSDFSGAFNHIWLYPFLSPTPSRPELPWIARISVNILDAILVPPETGQRLCITSWYPDWHLELTVMPEELPAFAAWLAKLAEAHDELWAERVADPPHPLQRALSREGMLEAASLWTVAALQKYDEFWAQEREREQRLRRQFEYQVALANLQQGAPWLPRRLPQAG
jgi:hypothetical protein